MVASTAWGDVTFPGSFVLDSLLSAIAKLAEKSADDQAAVAQLAQATVARTLLRFGQGSASDTLPKRRTKTASFPKTGPGGLGSGLIRIDGRRAFVLGIVSGLSPDSLRRQLRECEAALAKIDAKLIRSKSPDFSPDGEVFRLIVIGGPYRPAWSLQHPFVLIHIEELIDILLDCDQGSRAETPRVVSFWQFVMEVARARNVHIASLTDVEDAWQVWSRLGTLNPTALDDVVLVSDPVPAPSRWDWSAAWEPCESRLAEAGYAPHREWQHATLEENAEGAELWAGGASVLVSGNLRLVVAGQINPKLSTLSLDPIFSVTGIADGVFLTFRNFPKLGAVLDIPVGKVLTLVIEVSEEAPPAPEEGLVGVGLATDGASTIGIKLGKDWLDLLLTDPHMAHRLLGMGIAESLIKIGILPVGERESFVDLWAEAPPVAMLHRRSEILPRPEYGRFNLPLGRSTESEADRYLATVFARRRLRQGLYGGRAASQFFDDHIAPALEEVLRSLISTWSPASTRQVVEHLNAAHADRYRRETELDQALSAPWAEHWRTQALMSRDPAEVTRPLEHLVELLMLERPTGELVPDRYDIATATDVIGSALQMGLLASAAHAQIHGLAIQVGPGGLVRVAPAERRSSVRRKVGMIDVEKYRQARDRERLRGRPIVSSTDDELHVGVAVDMASATASEFVPIEALQLPKSLLKADAVLKDAVGTGMNGLNAILGTAVNWSGFNDPVASASADGMLAAAHSWSGIPMSELEAGLNLLLLTSERLQAEPFHYWEQERRQNRLATRPLIGLSDDEVLFAPWMIHRAQSVFAAYLLDGRLPWRPADVPPAVRDAFVRFRQVLNDQLQREAVNVIRRLGFALKQRVDPAEAARYGIRLPGEVDVMAADAKRRKLWICEVKDLSPAASPSTVSVRLEKYLAPDGYVDQLVARTEAAASAVKGALRLLGLSPEKPWRWDVLPLMITRRVEPAAFAYGLSVPFVTIGDLHDMLIG